MSHTRRSAGYGVSIPTTISLALLGCLVVATSSAAQPYMGSDWCFNCHPSNYNEWKVSGHPFKLMKAGEAINRPLPLPEGYSWNDISYVIGGYKWKSRYMGSDGYIITSIVDEETGEVIEGVNQYNNMTGEWVDYHAGETKPYDCGRCHTTGWMADEDWETDGDLSDNQDGLPGIHGTFQFGGIHCEECHGPGFTMEVDRSSELCGGCHIRGAASTIPARGGFIRHHEQYNEQLASPHAGLECVSCHNPHKKSELSIHTTCADCHGRYAAAYEGTPMEIAGVGCEDCHMPFASKSAVAFSPYRADVRAHLFRINTDKNGQMFTDDGNFVLLDDAGQGALSLGFACGDCHRDKNSNWLAGKAKNFHQRRSSYIDGG